MVEQVNHPPHYQGAAEQCCNVLMVLGIPPEMLGGECIEAIEHLNCNFHVGNAVKYLWRCGQKNDAVKDLEKSRWYLERYLERVCPGSARSKTAIGMIDVLIRVSQR